MPPSAQMATAAPATDAPDRALLTILMTDIVGSTARAVAEGDRRWRWLLERHDRIARRVTADFGGRYVKSLGDGLLATFPSPAGALSSAGTLQCALAELNLSLRVGVHAGEVELIGDDIGGISVNIAARVCALALAGEILVTRMVCDLLEAAGPEFCERGTHLLKGIPKPWALYAARPRSAHLTRDEHLARAEGVG